MRLAHGVGQYSPPFTLLLRHGLFLPLYIRWDVSLLSREYLFVMIGLSLYYGTSAIDLFGEGESYHLV